ncbi:xylulokinase [Microbacterium sp. KRD172]|uniref:xylulokinase n=1 Tax=Microbacterium sp. KRD172 TaxID=2729727 RepID=UPI0019D14B17|nr:FGGY family carbohydrate kinase [Microbacterium sp. KRD172]
MSYVLGIDIGTSGCKVTALDESGDAVATVSREWFPIVRPNGTSEQDPQEWIDGVREAISELSAGLDDSFGVKAIGVTGQMQGATFVDEAGTPVRPSILWNDTRSSPQTREIIKGDRKRIEGIIGAPFSDGLTLGKLLWVRANEPENWARLATVLHAPEFIVQAITGQRLADVNNLGQSGMNDVAANDWSYDLLDEFDIPRTMVPPVVACDEVAATTTETAAVIGLPAGIPVVCAGGDSGAEGFSLGLAGLPRLKVRLGTAADLNLVRPYDPNRGGFRDVVPGHVLVGAYTKSCASSVRWVREMFFTDRPQTTDTFAFMDACTVDVPAGSDGLIFHPYLMGEATPYFNSAMSGMLHGLRAGMGRGHVTRAMYEGIAMSIRDILDHTPDFAHTKEIVVLGGGAKSEVFVSSLVDVLGRDGIVPPHGDAAYGAALLAGHTIGVWDGFERAAANVAAGRRVAPDSERHAVLSENYARYLADAQREDARTAVDSEGS